MQNADCDFCGIQQAFDRLAAYEDTGLTPEEITRIQERLQIDPFGSDKIDELEEAIGCFRDECDDLKKENAVLKADNSRLHKLINDVDKTIKSFNKRKDQ